MSDEPQRPKHKTAAPALSAREIAFAQLVFQYGVRGKARAYVEAGFPPKGTPNATEAAACRIVRKRQFREYVRHLEATAAEAATVTVQEIVVGVLCIARADRRKLFDKRGVLLPPDQIPDDVAAAIEGVESEDLYEPVPGERGKKRLKGHLRKIKTGNRLAAWRTLAEWKRMLGTDKAAATGPPSPLVVVAGPEVVPPPPDEPDE
jgi:hypothetical protein